MLEVPGHSAGNVKASEVVGVGGNVDVGAGVRERMEEKRFTRKKRMDTRPTVIPAIEESRALMKTTRSSTVVARLTTKRCDAQTVMWRL